MYLTFGACNKGSHKKNGLFTVRLTVRVPPPLTVRLSGFFQNKLTYFDSFYYFIMGQIGPKFSHLLTVRAEGADPPSPPYGQPDRKKTVFFTTSLRFDLIREIII